MRTRSSIFFCYITFFFVDSYNIILVLFWWCRSTSTLCIRSLHFRKKKNCSSQFLYICEYSIVSIFTCIFLFPAMKKFRSVMETGESLNPDILVEKKDNSIEEESRRSQSDYNRSETLRLSNRYTNSRGRSDFVEHNDLVTRAPSCKQSKN
jgi:hypothetical protein